MQDELATYAASKLELEIDRINLVKRMVALSRRSVVYLTKARMWHAESITDYKRALKKQSNARDKLMKLTGAPEDVVVIQRDPPEVTLSVDQLVDTAYKNRPEIALAGARAELAKTRYNFECNKRLPRPTFVELSHHLETDRSDWTELSFGIKLPLFNWNSGNVRAMNLAVDRQESELSSVQEQIEFEVIDAVDLYRDSYLDWEYFKRDTDTLIQESQAIIEEAEQHQVIPLDEILELKMMVVDMQKLLSEKRRQLMYSMIDLCSALGIETLSAINTSDSMEGDTECL